MTEPPLGEVAHASERTVQRVAEEDTGEPPRRPRRARKKGAVVAEVTYTKVRQDVWDKARDLARHPSHIQIISEEEVIVWNHPAPWPGRTGERPAGGRGDPQGEAPERG